MKAKLVSFVISESTRTKKGRIEAVQAPAVKSAPHYFEKTVPQQFIISQEGITVSGHEGTSMLKTYQPDILLVEATFDVSDIFSDDLITFKEEVMNVCREMLKKKGGKDVEEFSEEYSIYAVSNYDGDPEQFLKYKDRIAGLLKSEKLAVDPLEIDYTLSSQLKYAKNDLVVVDWDGAFLFDPDGDFEQTIELFQLANLELLRYRILDKALDDKLRMVAHVIEHAPVQRRFFFTPSEVSQTLRDLIKARATSISEFQALDREIKLIGDWYSARLYDLTAKKFKIEEWRKSVKDKLESIEDVYAIASENFTISWERRGRIIEMVGWYVLLIGWLVLLVLDFYFYKIK
ncbi:MAG: hypothetical protein UX72_C0003G0071 [Parcubacteria group bacterium GW2011_GWA2_47_10]|nr:MAG: hypothetical protein UX72_C0003G0071 [Parcubacteria group bacterium GW2011_GWA2_47_10]